MDGGRRAGRWTVGTRGSARLRHGIVALVGTLLLVRMAIEALTTGASLDTIMNLAVIVLLFVGFLLLRHLFATTLKVDVDELHPPLGWTPSMPEGFAQHYRGFQMRVDEGGRLVPAGGSGDRGRRGRRPDGAAQPYSIAVGAAEAAGGELSYYASSSELKGTTGGWGVPVAGGTTGAAVPVVTRSGGRGVKRRVLAAPQAGQAVDTQVEVGPRLRADGSLPTPQEIYDALGAYVIGQEEARKTLSVAVYNHYKRTLKGGPARTGEVEIAKSNIMLLGPTGSGKTLMVQTLARILDVPFAISDATTLTDAGYVGDDVESMLGRLIAAAGSNESASLGIIYVDEIDKIARKTGKTGAAAQGDPSGEGVQQAMLKLLEGTLAKVPPLGGRTNLFQKDTLLDTTNILFICGGAFVGLADIVRRRVSAHGIGFAAPKAAMEELSDDKLLGMVEPQDLHQFGLIPEFIGRIPVITHTDALDKDAMVRILTEPRNALIRQYQALFAYDGVTLEFDRDAMEAIGEEAIMRGTGARGLRSICERVLRDAMFELPGRSDVGRVTVHRSCVTDGEPLAYAPREG